MSKTKPQTHALTFLCPITNGSEDDRSFAATTKARLQELAPNEESPFSRVPNTYLCRLFVLHDVVYQGKPAHLDHLKSRYLVGTFNIHGDLTTYLEGLWENATDTLRQIFEHCVGFSTCVDSESFARYVQKCQVPTTFLFNGSNDDSLAEQLKSLYLKQEFAAFAAEHQRDSPEQLQEKFLKFVKRTQPENLKAPTWRAGAASLDVAVQA